MASSSTKIASGSCSSTETGEQLLNKDGTRRKSRVLRRKTDHSIIERRRREKINEKLVALQNLVPACRKECQDLIERKFTTPARANDAGDTVSAPRQNAKRKREEEKVDKAKKDMSDKISTSMVLEKLCIISHTLDFVVKLQEENKALRALCDCRAEQELPVDVESGLAEHYRNAHRHESSDSPLPGSNEARGKMHRLSVSTVSSSSDHDALAGDDADRPAKRRLHWGSDER
ncbi:Myc-type, basic helix-loop-helix (bHLH) domain protein [Kalmanozyma brasiliensis GHG001]|uniref:Myc-type, basic helix-loop-helix (bHLH) domain protein n=1 Tax=Kalmanozyma brasiliensis (strain GHG001) TaxID=1365824 RepID=UPI001CEBE826|nr:Myc-type, basic helix-loop-helix (bHLH) domain protein [Kalmanozyma brasiliensis GHG001]KAF6767594.1 Myc-type, basic helix-loop-helix (bHLH) domain protein [Kalmanozyma brasiliensis GHG001]